MQQVPANDNIRLYQSSSILSDRKENVDILSYLQVLKPFAFTNRMLAFLLLCNHSAVTVKLQYVYDVLDSICRTPAMTYICFLFYVVFCILVTLVGL